MPKYKVGILRTGYGDLEIEVYANSRKEASEISLRKAGSYVFSERDADYSIRSIVVENLSENERGASSIEYALIVTGLSIAAVLGYELLGVSVRSLFEVANRLLPF